MNGQVNRRTEFRNRRHGWEKCVVCRDDIERVRYTTGWFRIKHRLEHYGGYCLKRRSKHARHQRSMLDAGVQSAAPASTIREFVESTHPRGRSKISDGALFKALTSTAIFFSIFSSKLLLVHAYALPHPFWDAWHVEGEWLYKPFLTKTLTLGDLFKPASEHRILVLRLYDLALLSLNGQWDVALQMALDAALFALFGCILWYVLSESLDRWSSLTISIVIMVLLALPLGWENTLNGHHAGWFFLYIFSILGIWLAVNRPPLSLAWCLCLPSFAAAYFSQFSGVLSPLAAATAIIFGMLLDRRMNRRDAIAAILLAGLTAIGFATQPRFEGQVVDRAQSVDAFLKSLGYALVWPHWEVSWLLVIVHAPFIITIFCLLFKKLTFRTPSPIVVGLGSWTYLQGVGMAYARGRQGLPQAIRYMDILTIGIIVNFVALILLTRWKSKPWRCFVAVLALVWIWSTWTGLERRTAYQYAVMLPAKRKFSDIEELNLRAYAATGRFIYLANKPSEEIAYYGGPAKVATLLSDPVLRMIYPASIRPPLAVDWPPSSVFQDKGYAAYTPPAEDIEVLGTYTANGNATKGSIQSGVVSPPRLPFLEFRVTGDLGRPGLSLKLEGQSGKTTLVEPPAPSLTNWTAVRVPAPTEPFRIIADDESQQGWFAFCQPREMGRLSFYANWLLEHGPGFLVAGKTLVFLLILYQLFQGLVILRERRR